MTHQSSKDGVIASIQALRAFAVSWVVIDHAFPHSLPGGFIGVDVFFVISGFLITAHLLKQIETGSFTFAGFYLRRARRLLPAAVLVLAVTAVASLLLLPAAWKADTLSGIGAAAVYAVNWWLAAQSVDYFADSGVISPVNHYWSLSVEEQFYLVWPALIMITLWGVRRLPRPPSPAAAVGGLMALLAVLSFTAAVTAMQADRQAAYFFTHARAWEFAAGGIAAWAVRSGAPDRGWLRRPAARAAVLLAGWAVLLSSGWMLSPQSAVPGLAAIPVVVATALLLVLGDAHGVAPAGAVFRWGPVRRLGDVSYALYLWHWPLLVLAPFALPALEGHWALAAGAILLSLGLAGLTYRHVENRFRQTRAGTAQRTGVAKQLAFYLALSAGTAMICFGIARVETSKAVAVADRLYRLSLNPAPCFGAGASAPGAHCPDSHRLTDPDFALQNWASQILTPPNGTLCQNQPGDPTPAPCGFGAPEQDARHHIALFGDSHAGMWAAALIQFAEREGIRVHAYLASSCGATDDPLSFATYLTMDRREACNAWRAAATDQILSDPRIAVVVVSANAYSQKVWAGDRWAEDDGTGFAALWTRLRAAGKQVLVIDDVPMLPMKLPDCLARPHPADDPCTRPAQEVPQLTSLARGVALLPADEVHYVAMRDIFCDGDTCHAIIGGIPAYMDSDHISAPMARSLAPWIEPAVMQALSSQP